MSAGSVNQWGYCEICGEDFEDPGSLIHWHDHRNADVVETSLVTSASGELSVVGQDAA